MCPVQKLLPFGLLFWKGIAKIDNVFEKSKILGRKSYEIPFLLYEMYKKRHSPRFAAQSISKGWFSAQLV